MVQSSQFWPTCAIVKQNNAVFCSILSTEKNIFELNLAFKQSNEHNTGIMTYMDDGAQYISLRRAYFNVQLMTICAVVYIVCSCKMYLCSCKMGIVQL